jgi:hypothetical protein
METKFFLRSLAVWGIVVSSLCAFIRERTGVDLSDQAGPLQQAIQGIINALPVIAAPVGQFAGVIMVIVGRFRATQPLHIIPQTPSSGGGSAFSPTRNVSMPVALAGAGLLALGLFGCAGTNASPAGGASSSGTATATATNGTSTATNAIEAALPLIRTGAAVATGAVLDFAVEQSSTRTRLANEMYAAASSVYSLTGGTFPTPAQFQANILAFGGSQTDANYAQFSTAIASLYGAYYPKLVTGDSKTATDLLNAIAGGIEDATASYVTTPAVTATTAAVTTEASF